MELSLNDKITFLKDRPMFKDMQEMDVRNIAERMEEYTVEPGKNLFSERDRGSVFYIVYQGKVRIWTYNEEDEERDLGILEIGDTLGEESLLLGSPRSATVTALEKTTFLSLHKPDFEGMVEKFPEIDDYLTTLMETRRKARNLYFPWLHPGEIPRIIERRHPIIFFAHLTRPLLALLIGVFFLYIATLTQLEILPTIIGAIILVVSVLWGIWEYLDWYNDYFILTNQRIVWLEKVIFQDAARREAPLAAVQSVDVKTSQVGRILDYGNVLVRTFTGTGSLTLTNVNHPKQMKGEIEELLLRVRQKTDVLEEELLRQSIRQSLGLETAEITDPVFHLEAPEEVRGSVFTKILKTREVSADGRTITYHRHWWVLLTKTWLPLLAFFGLAALLVYGIINQFQIIGIQFPRLSFFTFWFLGLLADIGIFAYHVADWNNDIYKINKDDMLIDSEKKPFGEEISRSAPIRNIISLEHQRTGILRLLLNFGIVRVVVADATLTFYDVHNPAQVQQDIYYRQEQIKLKNQEAEMESDRAHISRWLSAYHEINEQEIIEKKRRFAADFEDQEEI